MIERGAEHDAALVRALLLALLFDGLRARWDAELRAERGEAWWRENERYLDGWWQMVVDQGFV